MVYYGVHLCSFVQFNYYKDDIFLVKIFEESGIESKHPDINPVKYFKSK